MRRKAWGDSAKKAPDGRLACVHAVWQESQRSVLSELWLVDTAVGGRSMELTRREFMRSTGGATLALCLERLSFGALNAARPAHADALPLPNYAAWEDVYRNQWT